jgi:uncharacterized glyoxalase superfamily protein PhnB
MSTTLETLQATGMMPSLTANDVQQSVDFFQKLGFIVEERWEEGGTLQGVMLRAGDFRIGLSQDDGKKGRNREKGVGMRIYISTQQDVDRLAQSAKAAGLTLDSDPHDTEWGSRAFDVTEPSGFKLTISTEEQK